MSLDETIIVEIMSSTEEVKIFILTKTSENAKVKPWLHVFTIKNKDLKK